MSIKEIVLILVASAIIVLASNMVLFPQPDLLGAGRGL
jgi:O-antigen/teichoic acid export membrane protein